MEYWSPKNGDLRVAGIKPDSASNPNGTIDGMPIGSTTPSTGAFTTLSVGVGAPINSGATLAAGLTSAPALITTAMVEVTTADATHIAVILPTGAAGDSRLVHNSGGASAQTIDIFCQSTDTIDGGSAGGNVTLTVAHRGAWFNCVAPNKWISELIGAASS